MVTMRSINAVELASVQGGGFLSRKFKKFVKAAVPVAGAIFTAWCVSQPGCVISVS